MSAAQSGAVGDGEESWLEAEVTGPGYLTFYWRTSSEGGYDMLHCILDWQEEARVSGETEWRGVGFYVAAGQHMVSWVYAKDLSGRAGQDAGWVDQVVYAPESGPCKARTT